MSQIIFKIDRLPPVIDIGKQTEKGVTRVGFDVHEWLDDWPGMRFSVRPTRPGETESYTAATDMVGSVIFWLVGAVDTEKPGSGTVEVLGVTEDERKLSFMCRTAIANTNTVTTAEIPEPNRPWVDQVIMAGETAKEKAKEAAESAVSAFQSEQTAGQHSVNAEEKARSAAQSELEATKAMNVAVVQADDAKAYAKAAEESAKSADDSGRLAQSMSDSARENANAAREHALSAQQNASEAAKSAEEAAESVKDFYVVTVTEKNGVQMASSDAMTIWQMAEMGKVCLLVSREHQRAYMYTGYADGAKFDAVAQFPVPDAIPGLWLSSATVADDGTVTFADELPAKTPNPHKLTLTGGEEAEYDGSEAVNVEIPAVFIIKAANSVNGVNQPADKTRAEIKAARDAGKVCLLLNTNSHRVYTYYGLENDAYVFKATVYNPSAVSGKSRSLVAEVRSDNTVYFYENPLTAPNPKYLRFTGAVKASYYGGEEVTVEIPAGGGGLPETANPLKQLVTDNTGKVVWEDRLAYTYTGKVVNLEETALVFAGDDGFVLGVPWAADVAAGSVCTVKYNGVDYDCTAIDYAAIMPPEAGVQKGVCALGNLDVLSIPGITGGNADAPFVLMTVPGAHAADMGAYAMLMPMDGATSVTLAVRSVGEIIKKIDKKYLPEVTGGIVTAHAKITTLTADKITLDGCDMTFAALWDAYSTGKMVQIMCSNETRMLCGRVNAGMINDGAKALQMDVPRDIALVGHFVVAAADDGTGNVGFDMIGKVL